MRFEATIAPSRERSTDPARAVPPPTLGARGPARRATLRGLSQQCRGRPDRLAGDALSRDAPAGRRRFLSRAWRGAFVAAHKPRSPVLIYLRRRFPRLRRGFEPARDIPYLADVARLENAWVEAYHAAEADAAALADLAAVAPERLGEIALRLSPRRCACCGSPIPPPRSGRGIRARASRGRPSIGGPRTR